MRGLGLGTTVSGETGHGSVFERAYFMFERIASLKKKTTSKRFLSLFVGFLELINNMLTSGMVPALFPDDEKEAIIGQVKSTILIHHSQDGTSC